VWRQDLIAGQASLCARVGAAKWRANQAATAGWKSVDNGESAAICVATRGRLGAPARPPERAFSSTGWPDCRTKAPRFAGRFAQSTSATLSRAIQLLIAIYLGSFGSTASSLNRL
jgi:hypothetical protein